MTTQPAFPRNKVILFAQVDQRRQNRKEIEKKAEPEAAIRKVRNAQNGADYLVSLQVAAPYGGSYQMDVEVGSGTPGVELLSHAQAGLNLVLEGYLTRTREVDRRFADFEEEMIEGVIYQDVVFQVESVRGRQSNDPQGTGSNVWIEGEVTEPPVFFRHPEFPEIELARIGVRTRTKTELGEGVVRPGRPCEVTVIVPTDEESVEFMYRRGNRVKVRGVLERVAMRQNRDIVREKVAELEEAWYTKREEVKDDARQLRIEGGRFLRSKERLERSPRTMVLAAEVTPMAGAQPLDREAAAADRDAFAKEMQQQRRARMQQRRARTNRAAAPVVAESGEAAEATAEPVTAEVVTETVKPLKPRPRRHAPEAAAEPVAAEAPAAEALAETAPIVAAEVVYTNGATVEA